jgi:hypothetical protein
MIRKSEDRLSEAIMLKQERLDHDPLESEDDPGVFERSGYRFALGKRLKTRR